MGDQSQKQTPMPDTTRLAKLVDPSPAFIVRHADGSTSVLSAISPQNETGIGHTVSWCPSTRTFQEPMGGLIYDEDGAALSSAGALGLVRYQTRPVPNRSDAVVVGDVKPPLPPSRAPGPERQGYLCHDGHDLRVRYQGIQPTPHSAFAQGLPGEYVQFDGKLIVPSSGRVVVANLPRTSCVVSDQEAMPCRDPVPVVGVDRRAILTFAGTYRYRRSGTWLAKISGGGLSHLTFVQAHESRAYTDMYSPYGPRPMQPRT